MPLPDEIDVTAAARRFSAGAMLLDVREPAEVAHCAIPGSTAIPLRELPSTLERLPRDRDLLVLCHHGGRSRMVAGYLRALGFTRACNVAGGIAAWAEQVDPTLPRY